MATKPRLTTDEHADLGSTLAGIRDELTHRRTQLLSAYPKTGREARPANHLQAAVRAIDDARTALESLCLAQHPDSTTNTYWPTAERRANVTRPQTIAKRFCDGCNAAAPTAQQLAHDPWCPVA